MTQSEAKLWKHLRNRQLDGKKFLRQHKIIYAYSERSYHFFVLDFYCAEERLAIELDGEIHKQQIDYDLWRSSVLEDLNIRVLRLSNIEMENLENVKDKIREAFFESEENNSPPAPLL
jgi:very-short-patch-repair endonuclease